MAKVIVEVVGGKKQELEALTVGGLKILTDAKNYTALVNDEPATDSQELVDGDYIMLSTATKGA